MEDIIDFFKGLFRYDLWPPRWKCGYWSDFHGWLYIVSELMIWAAYFLIPLIIIQYFLKKGNTIRFRRVYLLFASFILLCGATHFIDAMMFWVPIYRFNALLRLATGVVSLFTVYHLLRVLPNLFKQRTNTELENEIARRVEAEQRLEEANKGLQAFAYIASHDLQEPLRKISTFTNLLYEKNQDQFDQQSKVYAEKIHSSADRMRSLVQDVLSLSTITEETALKTVDTHAAVRKAVEDLELLIKDRGAIVEVQSLPKVMGNSAYLTQLFYNLIGNAIKFNKNNQPTVSVTGESKDASVFIKVKDNGIGMDIAFQERIFEPFQRLHEKSQYEGSGIGLAIVKKIVKLHNGRIHIDSEIDRGTTFSIELNEAQA